MKEIAVKKHKILLWETIDELPIERFMAYNKYLMISGALGSTFEDIDANHLHQLVTVIDDKVKVIQQVTNLRELIYNIINEVNYDHHAFACLVYSIDGEVMSDITDNGLKRTLKRLSDIGISNADVKKKTKKSRKPFSLNWKRYFRINSTGARNTTTTPN